MNVTTLIQNMISGVCQHDRTGQHWVINRINSMNVMDDIPTAHKVFTYITRGVK